MDHRSAFGEHLREWRRRRHLSQLDLACEADISTRHLSFLETGRAAPSREMVLHLAERLDLPLRERNALLLAAGYAPGYPERALGTAALDAVRQAVSLVLTGHEPYPALAIDRHWTMVAGNRALAPLLAGVDPSLLAPPVNVLRLGLHPLGLAPRIVNLPAWRAHLLERVQRQARHSRDETLVALARELQGYPVPFEHRTTGTDAAAGPAVSSSQADVFVPLILRTDAGTLTFLSTTTVFGTPRDITVAELAIEAFFPADAPTAEVLRLAAVGQESLTYPRQAVR